MPHLVHYRPYYTCAVHILLSCAACCLNATFQSPTSFCPLRSPVLMRSCSNSMPSKQVIMIGSPGSNDTISNSPDPFLSAHAHTHTHTHTHTHARIHARDTHMHTPEMLAAVVTTIFFSPIVVVKTLLGYTVVS